MQGVQVPARLAPEAPEYVPAVQEAQVLARLAPAVREYVPGRHSVQAVRPAESPYEPARQFVHDPLDAPP